MTTPGNDSVMDPVWDEIRSAELNGDAFCVNGKAIDVDHIYEAMAAAMPEAMRMTTKLKRSGRGGNPDIERFFLNLAAVLNISAAALRKLASDSRVNAEIRYYLLEYLGGTYDMHDPGTVLKFFDALKLSRAIKAKVRATLNEDADTGETRH